MNPQAVLQERYPLADFSVYFRHLAACRTAKHFGTHEHHICPRKQFPEYEAGFPENLVTLTADDHDFAHKVLEAACGIKASASVYARCGGLIGGAKNVASGHIAALNSDVEHQARAGRNGGKVTAALGYLDFEHQAQAGKIGGRLGGHRRWHVNRNIVSPNCSLCGAL